MNASHDYNGYAERRERRRKKAVIFLFLLMASLISGVILAALYMEGWAW
jgi:hypothetical protein